MSMWSEVGQMALGLGMNQGMQDTSNFLGMWTGNSAKESLNKNIISTNLKKQKAYDSWRYEKDKEYEEWYQNLLFGLQDSSYFNLAKKYGENTAKWSVTGLKNAGLNPVLAAGGGFTPNIGNASPSSGSHSSSSGSVHGASVGTGSIAGNASSAAMTALQQIRSSARQMQIADEQSAADLLVKQAQAASLQADAASKSMGNTDWGRNLASVGMMLDSVGLKRPLKELGIRAADWMIRQMGTKQEPTTGKQQSALERPRVDTIVDSPARGNIAPSFTPAESRELQRSLERSTRRNIKRYNDHIRSNGGILNLR